MGGAAGGAEALIVDRCAHHQEVAAGETSHPALITYTNLIDSDHMGNLSPPTPGHWRYLGSVLCKIEALFARERQLADPSLACYRWITGINCAATEVSNDTSPSSLVISGSPAALSIPVIQR